LCLTNRFEATHKAFSLPSRLMADFNTIVGVTFGCVIHSTQNLPHCRGVASQLIRDDPQWLLALASQESSKKPLRSSLISAQLHQNVNHIPILIYRSI
jgi:hypothetical protein